MNDDLLYQVALTMVPQIGDVYARTLVEHFGDARSIFRASQREMEALEGIGAVRAASIKSFKDFKRAEEELEFISKYSIQPLFITDAGFPHRLLNCYDTPVLLYYKGKANLNDSRIISIVGTRHCSNYGKQICEKLIAELRPHSVIIVSGLAFGIDTTAHKAALQNQMQTIGVLAHGLDRIYPTLNSKMAREMLAEGGLITNFRKGTPPDRQNFPSRNRIAAGMSDCIIVVETAVKGGSIITAELGNSYNRDVFAFPGRVTDSKSSGCNYLIQSNKAALITSADDLLDMMDWKPKTPKSRSIQKQLYPTLSADEKTILDLLANTDAVHIDELCKNSKLSAGTVAQALLLLEMQGIVSSLPGRFYRST